MLYCAVRRSLFIFFLPLIHPTLPPPIIHIFRYLYSLSLSGLTAAGLACTSNAHIPTALKSVMNLTTKVTSIGFHPSGAYLHQYLPYVLSLFTTEIFHFVDIQISSKLSFIAIKLRLST